MIGKWYYTSGDKRNLMHLKGEGDDEFWEADHWWIDKAGDFLFEGSGWNKQSKMMPKELNDDEMKVIKKGLIIRKLKGKNTWI